MFITNYAYNKLIRKKSHYLFSIVSQNNETIETCIGRLKIEKMEITQCLNSFVVKAFCNEIKNDTSISIKLTKTTL